MCKWKCVLAAWVLASAVLAQGHAETMGATITSGYIRGVIRPVNEPVLSTDLVARVVSMPFREGDSFERDALLIEFDCTRYKAEAAAAWAAHTASRRTYETNRELAQYNAVGRSDLELSKAEMAKAASEAKATDSRTVDCEIRAPFPGRVAERLIHTHETSAPGAPLLKIVDDSQLEIELVVPSRWLVWLEPGATFRFQVDETDTSHSARVIRLGGTVDPVSQTIKLFAELDSVAEGVLSGMSGSADFDIPEVGQPRS